MKTGKSYPNTNLKKLREKLGLSQESIADQLGCNIKTYREYELGKAKPGAAMLMVMYDFFRKNNCNISTDYLLDLSDFNSPENDFIGKETGLNDDTIEVLKSLDSEQIETLNDFMDQYHFKTLLSAIYKYSHSHNDKAVVENTITQKKNDYITGSAIYQFSASNLFNHIIELIYKQNEIQGNLDRQNYLIELLSNIATAINKETDPDEKNKLAREYWDVKTEVDLLQKDLKKYKGNKS